MENKKEDNLFIYYLDKNYLIKNLFLIKKNKFYMKQL